MRTASGSLKNVKNIQEFTQFTPVLLTKLIRMYQKVGERDGLGHG
jgi:hypothetical protein